MINLLNVNMTYNISQENQVIALNEISLEIKTGEFVSIVGNSGSGKSTLLHVMSGLEAPTNGTIIFDEVNIYNLSCKKLGLFRNTNIGFVFQNFYLESFFTAIENVMLPLLVRKDISIIEAKNMAEKQLNRLGLSHRYHHRPNQLSGGEKQRVAIARALVTNPKIIFADEPCGNLDNENSRRIMAILKELTDEDKTVVLVTHNKEEEKLSDTIISIDDGKITTVVKNKC